MGKPAIERGTPLDCKLQCRPEYQKTDMGLWVLEKPSPLGFAVERSGRKVSRLVTWPRKARYYRWMAVLSSMGVMLVGTWQHTLRWIVTFLTEVQDVHSQVLLEMWPDQQSFAP